MEATLKALINLRNFTTGRRLYAMGEAGRRAKARGLGDLAKLAQKTTRHDTKVLEIEGQWEELKAAKSSRDNSMSLLDGELDRTLGAFSRVAEDQSLPLAEEQQKAIRAMLRAAFPTGVGDVVRLTYIEQHAKVGRMIRVVETKHAEAIAAAGLGAMLARLKDLHARYGAALEGRAGGKGKTIDFSTVRAEREKGQDLMLYFVVRVLADHFGDKSADVEARNDLLEPILEQNDAIGVYLSAHRKVADVDPTTGVEVEPTDPE